MTGNPFKLWSWGANSAGQLGHGYSSEQVSQPTQARIDGLQVKNGNLLQISGGGSHTIICNSSEEDERSQFFHLGLLGTKLEYSKREWLPNPAEGNVSEKVVSGWDFSLFINSSGNLYSIGDNSYRQLGDPSVDFARNWTQVQAAMPPLRDISAGMRHTVGIGTDSTLVFVGDNSKGQAGLPTVTDTFSRVVVIGNLSFRPAKVRCGKTVTIILAEDGYFYGAGLKKFGMLGDQHKPHVLSHFTKLFTIDKTILDFRCGWNHVLVLCEDGELLTWGRNNFSQLGRESVTDYDTKPGRVEGMPEPAVSIACGSEHNLVIGASGKVYSWGWNEHDNCGIQSTDYQVAVIHRPTGVHLPPTESAVVVGCGGGSSYALTRTDA